MHAACNQSPLGEDEPGPCRVIRLLSAAVLSSMLAAGCASLPPHERQLLTQAAANYTRGDVSAANSQLDRIIRDYDTTPEIAEAYYLRGLCRWKSQQPSAASQDFERGIAKSRREDLTAHCRAALAAMAFERSDWEQAAELYAKALPQIPDAAPTDEILYAAGLAMQRAGRWKEAATQYGRILWKFSNRPVAANARIQAGWRHPYYAVQLGAFRDADNAAASVQEFRKHGLDPEMENLPRGGQAIWVVMAGRYRTFNEAKAALPRYKPLRADATIIP